MKQLNITTPIDDDNIIEYIKIILLQLSVFTMKNNKKTSICVHEEVRCQCRQCLSRTNGNTWDFAQDNEMECNASIDSF